MREKIVKVYKFDELEEDVQEKVLEKYWDVNVDWGWWECILEDAERIGLKIGEFDIGRGSYCKGGWIEDAEYTAEKILQDHGGPCETYIDAVKFQNELKQAQGLFEQGEDYDPEYEFEEGYEYEEICAEFLKTICEDYRSILQEGYEYLTSKEAIVETIKANEYEFTADGKLW